jgi:hypothetical protein
MSIKSKNRKEAFNQRDSKKFFTVVGIAVLVLMLLMFLMYKNMG